ncbi:hypothetical protein VNO77_31321 [Canavalia gladiata]|uniref:Uncharacterized protein n=1 Tax=Canavalia gladiata TaxID=3824 RepID=A0AAN9Q7P0_CANGL
MLRPSLSAQLVRSWLRAELPLLILSFTFTVSEVSKQAWRFFFYEERKRTRDPTIAPRDLLPFSSDSYTYCLVLGERLQPPILKGVTTKFLANSPGSFDGHCIGTRVVYPLPKLLPPVPTRDGKFIFRRGSDIDDGSSEDGAGRSSAFVLRIFHQSDTTRQSHM